MWQGLQSIPKHKNKAPVVLIDKAPRVFYAQVVKDNSRRRMKTFSAVGTYSS